MDPESHFEDIIAVLKANGGSMPYKDLNEKLANKFEGVRLMLKVMKDKEIVDFEGSVPSFSSTISLVMD